MSICDNTLAGLLGSKFGLRSSRADTFSFLIRVILVHGSVCMHRLSAHMGGAAQLASVRQRIRRFFERISLSDAVLAHFLSDQLGLCMNRDGWDLQLDRTNWDFGSVTHNILMLSVVWNGSAIPLFWTMLPKVGNSDTQERADLLGRLRAVFPAQKIRSLTGDREFVGHAWLNWLTENKIPFVMRHRENMFVYRPNMAAVPLKWLARDLKHGDMLNLKGGWRIGKNEKDASPPLFLAMRRLKDGDLLILASTYSAKKSMGLYKIRWKIETLFGHLKTKGFNLEDTHMKDPKRLSTLLGILAIAASIAIKTGKIILKKQPIKIKKHGRPARSIFARGLDGLRKMIANSTLQKLNETLAHIASKKSNLKSLLDIGISM
jgi:Transposase DDE domain